jgi:hypothetical protein
MGRKITPGAGERVSADFRRLIPLVLQLIRVIHTVCVRAKANTVKPEMLNERRVTAT